MYNTLITSAGRRVELAKIFRQTLKEYDSQLFGADASLSAPALYFCDKAFESPRIANPDYIDTLIRLCAKNEIRLLVPTIDTDLMLLSRNRKRFMEEAGTTVVISDESVIEICRNKYNTGKFFSENGIPSPKLVDLNAEPKDLTFPLFIKPLNGSSSINAFKINNALEFDFFKTYVPEPIIQEFVDGVEYTIDVFCDFTGKPITIVPRQRLATRSGEILKGKIVKDRTVIEAAANLASKLKAIGHITLQCIKNDEGVFFIEINPRFGGGAPMSLMAGANSLKNLIRLQNKETLEYNEDYMSDIVFTRFDDSIALDKDSKVVTFR